LKSNVSNVEMKYVDSANLA